MIMSIWKRLTSRAHNLSCFLFVMKNFRSNHQFVSCLKLVKIKRTNYYLFYNDRTSSFCYENWFQVHNGLNIPWRFDTISVPWSQVTGVNVQKSNDDRVIIYDCDNCCEQLSQSCWCLSFMSQSYEPMVILFLDIHISHLWSRHRDGVQTLGYV